MLAARADRATIINAHVAAFSGGAGVAVIDAAVQYDSSADPGADGSVKHIAVPACGSPTGFGQGSCVCIIVDFDGDVIDVCHPGSQREVSPAWKVGRICYNAGLRIQGARRAYADALNLASRQG